MMQADLAVGQAQLALQLISCISKTGLCSRGALEAGFTPDAPEKSIFSR